MSQDSSISSLHSVAGPQGLEFKRSVCFNSHSLLELPYKLLYLHYVYTQWQTQQGMHISCIAQNYKSDTSNNSNNGFNKFYWKKWQVQKHFQTVS